MTTGGGSRVGAGFLPDGRTLATTGLSGVALWDVATGAARGDIGRGYGASDLALSARGDLAAYAMPGGGVPRADVYDVARGTRVVSVQGGAEGEAYTVALSPDGRLLAVGGYPRLVRVWNVRTGKLVDELDSGGAEALEFSPDGRILAVAGSAAGRVVARVDVSLWDVATGTQIGPSLSAGRRTVMIDISSDGRRLLMTAANGEGAVWDIDPQSWARRACRVANRTLTRGEWSRFLPGRPYRPACR
jgi:WD40 repeat protein